jgi:O-antigen/teichoic acid export membrane protein
MKRQIVLNALTTVGQTIASAAVLFFLYRFLIRTIGIDRLGIWSLVLATTSIVTLANQGFSTSIIKFVAQYAARDRMNDVSALIQTALISICAALALISVGLYPAARWALHMVLPAAGFAEADAILPLALVSLWLNVLEGLLQAGFAGHELITVCNYLEVAGALTYLPLAFLLVPKHGLLGLAYAQAIQAAAILVITWLLLRKRLPALPIVPYRWSRVLFSEMASYGLHFQLITLSQALREPVTKLLIAKFGGLALTGLYEMAARAVFTLREIIVQANQVLVPTISRLQQRDPASIPALYRESYRLVFFLAFPGFALLTALSPLISRVWIGHLEAAFVEFVAILSAGWLVNVLSNPAYVVDLGTGALRWVSVGCVATAVLNAILGSLAGRFAGGIAVAGASAFSLTCGYCIIVVAYHVQNHAPFIQLFPRESAAIVATSLAGASLFLPFFRSLPVHSVFSAHVTVAVAAALTTMVVIPMWTHPMRKRVLQLVFSRVSA